VACRFTMGLSYPSKASRGVGLLLPFNPLVVLADLAGAYPVVFTTDVVALKNGWWRCIQRLYEEL